MASKSTPITLREQLLVLLATLLAVLAAIFWSATHHAFLLYGDAEAHTHIARRLFDSHRPGLGQLGSVWLPLPHLLLAPFVAIDPLWRSGFAGAIPSAICYLLASLGLYRLARRWLGPLAATMALVFFAANPNLLYMATTAMSEPLFLAELIWAVLLLVEWHAHLGEPSENSRQWAVIAVLIAAVLTRYDGWILACLAWAAMATALFRRARLTRPGFVLASVALLAAPLAWMLYNQLYFGDWLDFMRGPYSAKAIELRTANGAIPPHPGWHNPWVSALFFAKAAELDSVARGWGWALWIASLVGIDWAWRRRMDNHPSPAIGHVRTSPLWTLLLWLPLPFYAYSVSFGSVPIFLPVWWPHSFYNTRYGMELLPALALFLGFFEQAGSMRHHHPRLDLAVTLLLFAAVGANIAAMLAQGPLVYLEGTKNAAARDQYNAQLSAALATLHTAQPGAIALMDTSNFPSIVPRAGMTYRQTLNESDKQFYAAALAAPADHAQIVLAFAGDTVAQAVASHPQGLRLYRQFHSSRQPDASLYLAHGFPDTVYQFKDSQPQEGRW